MKLLTIIKENSSRLGVKTDLGILDITAALNFFPGEDSLPRTIMEVIEGGNTAVAALQSYIDQVFYMNNSDKSAYLYKEDAVEFGPCVTHPNKIICVGLNYRKHAEETGAKIPEYPILFNKFNNTLSGNGWDIPLPKVSEKVDYEAELVIVIGKKAKYISKEVALSHVFGYCNVNDLSARDLQLRTNQWLLGKSCDGFSPLGPYLVTADEVGDPNNLEIKSFVNGEMRQSSHTSDMVFHCDEIVSYISRHMTLVPGDIILTGTPQGVILGYPEDKQVWLKDGDVVTIEIEKLGSLTNRMVHEY